MNDLAAIVTYNCIQESPEHGFKPQSEVEELYAYIMEEKHWEADIYILFDRLMKSGHMQMYEIDKRHEDKLRARMKKKQRDALSDPFFQQVLLALRCRHF